jgi:predicted RNA-binding protein YlqC (UPF0109 family)
MSGDQAIRNLIEYIAKQLVDDPHQVHVDEVDRGDHVFIKLSVAEEDLGKIIGKQGRTVKAMRALLSAISTEYGRRVTLEIVE